ncbi:hypothetical protein L6654_38845 [Bradyrhizobium sp. WYCCWR 13023]|uniref:Uncharacterized protein n=1 Tax=Bradyrhizobium zhengyangense TaxID=2911009 RepID=A0A9X1RJK8_9BRAD|nr:hypothetical protein [Bradyrhizobium zhengyangense]MCG2632568.1 hypothetical protein [Bradyrhizobium zhengyangense]
MRDPEFENVRVDTAIQRIAFPSVLDYVRFQLLATPTGALLGDRPESERQEVIGLRLICSFSIESTPAERNPSVFLLVRALSMGND